MTRERTKALRRRVYMALEQGPVGERAAVVIDRLLIVLIVINLAAVALDSVPAIHTRYQPAFDAIEYFSLDRLHRRVFLALVGRRRATGRTGICHQRRRG